MSKYTLEQIAEGIVSFADAEVLPVLDGSSKWLATAAVVALRQNPDMLAPKLSAMGLVDEGGMVDVDTAVEIASETAGKCGKLPVKIPSLESLMGKGQSISIALGKDEFDALYQHIKKAASAG